jgi:hypothetical protein
VKPGAYIGIAQAEQQPGKSVDLMCEAKYG